MSLPSRARTIAVDGVEYRWVVSTACVPDRLEVLAQHASGHGAKLVARTRWTFEQRAAHIAQRTQIGPRFVRAAIERARAQGWDGARPGVDLVLEMDEPIERVVRFSNPVPLRIPRRAHGSVPDVWGVDRAAFVAVDDFEIVVEQTYAPAWFALGFHSATRGRLALFGTAWSPDQIGSLRAPPCGTVAQPWHELEQGHELLLWRQDGAVYIAEGGEAWSRPAVFASYVRVDAAAYDARWRELIATYRRPAP